MIIDSGCKKFATIDACPRLFFVTSVVSNAILQGSISELTGGKFANGAMTAAFRVSFNDILESSVELAKRWNKVGGLLELKYAVRKMSDKHYKQFVSGTSLEVVESGIGFGIEESRLSFEGTIARVGIAELAALNKAALNLTADAAEAIITKGLKRYGAKIPTKKALAYWAIDKIGLFENDIDAFKLIDVSLEIAQDYKNTRELFSVMFEDKSVYSRFKDMMREY
ncbi:MAG: hypothetical protein DWP95_05930 [Proteobacteria bacterium]|nr:MAG: hypothetical protein DWP95_05930 [Pseudomonadota bacterium]